MPYPDYEPLNLNLPDYLYPALSLYQFHSLPEIELLDTNLSINDLVRLNTALIILLKQQQPLSFDIDVGTYIKDRYIPSRNPFETFEAGLLAGTELSFGTNFLDKPDIFGNHTSKRTKINLAKWILQEPAVLIDAENLTKLINLETKKPNLFLKVESWAGNTIKKGWDYVKKNPSSVGGAVINGINAIGPKTEDSATTSTLLSGGTKLAMQSGNPYLIAAAVAANAFNKFGSKKADTFILDADTKAEIGSDYVGSYLTIDKAAADSGKVVGGFDRLFSHKLDNLNKLAKDANRIQNIIAGINKTARERGLASQWSGLLNGILFLNEASDAYSAFYGGGVHSGKLGMKIEELFKFDFELLIPEPSFDFDFDLQIPSTEEVTKYLKGGSFNVIPEGALHARKHNIDLEDITKKGIPVISENEDGTVELHAEIEKEELIIRKEITEKLEELSNTYYKENTEQSVKDAVALEAGKLLVDEILHNTIDNVGLIYGNT